MIALTAAVTSAGALTWTVLRMRDAATAVEIPVPHDWSLLPDEAQRSAMAAVEECRRHPGGASGFAFLGRIYHGNAQPALAIPCYERALALGAGDPQTPYLLALLYEDWGRTREALDALRLVLARGDRYGPAWYHLGRNLLDAGETQAAIDAFTRAVSIAPGDAAFHTGLGRALREDRRLDDAIASLRQALAIDPEHPSAHQLLGLALREQGDNAGAAEHLARLRPHSTEVVRDPWLMEAQRHAASVEARLDLARSYIAASRLESAVRLLESLAAAHPDRTEVFRRLGEAHARSGRLDAAGAAYARAIDIEPGDASTRNALAENLMLRGDLDGAAAQVELGLAGDPDGFDLLVTRAAILLRRGRAQDAADRLIDLASRRGDHAAANFWLAEALSALGRHEEAAAAYERVLAARPGFAPAQRGLDQAYRTLGRP
jgi:tetratricopeptide (TPR) repeat protein